MADAALPIESYSNRARDAFQEIAEKRLRPPLTDPNFLVLHSRRVIFQGWIAQLPDKALSILDVGGRYQPYRPLFTGRVERYIGFDLLRTDFVDVVGTGENLPFASASFDLVIATQVFDCFKDPHRAAQQIHSVLKPGGALLASIPAMPNAIGRKRLGVRKISCEVSIVPIVANPRGKSPASRTG